MNYRILVRASRYILIIAGLTLAIQAMFPQTAIAQVLILDKVASESVSKTVSDNSLMPIRTLDILVTAYSSTPDQTDDTPFITANGTLVRDGIVAANWLPFGARVRLPDYFDDKVFVVTDRMHRRHSERLDIWMPTREAAMRWGVRTVRVEVL